MRDKQSRMETKSTLKKVVQWSVEPKCLVVIWAFKLENNLPMKFIERGGLEICLTCG